MGYKAKEQQMNKQNKHKDNQMVVIKEAGWGKDEDEES